MIRTFLSTLLFCASFLVSGQQLYEFQIKNHLDDSRYNRLMYNIDFNEEHTSISSVSSKSLVEVQRLKRKTKYWFGRKAFNENLVRISGDGYTLGIDPVVNFQLGRDFENNENKYVNSRGFLIQGKLGKGFSFYSTFIENQAILPSYIDNYVDQHLVVPGQGYSRDFGNGGRDYSVAGGEISYSPNKMFNFTLGQGTNFFGEGYRSMLLSDVAYNYPFFRIQTEFWKIKYVNLWGQLRDVRDEISPGNVFAKKYISSHYLSYNISDRWNLSFFETIILADTNQQRGLDPAFLNPIIFYRPVEFSIGSGSGNALLGFASSYKIADGFQAYGQFVLDEFTFSEFFANTGYWANKYGLQIGLKHYNTLGVKGLFTRLEFNHAPHYTYSHKVILANYGHYGQPLAHPWGANFNETLLHVLYTRDRWEIEARLHIGQIGLDTANSNWGSNIYLSYDTREADYGNTNAQGVRGNLMFLFLRAAWVVNPASNLKIEAGIQYRNLSTSQPATSPVASGSSNYVFFGLRTDLYNRYYDF
jgi:hypothetical protein